MANEFDFKPGDTVQFCGENAIVLSNHGDGGGVDLSMGIGPRDYCYWRWMFQGTPVTLVERAK